ncbi:uncharacterized protein LY79DRAFT_139055 [Colletotrichum navitas]|uniref:Uncharacterized protein n=1 Tax=Colletotrichum navitas TaxID=681940 RepID=A0AAD8QB86_9PEZI|nr:uncharacterized protein LY79DRAFT_139055 [Colletotrichum navitas]KAK1599377.1 hypothetical protein LY79DRAFT_139055 [Colletotrichum navitas]
MRREKAGGFQNETARASQREEGGMCQVSETKNRVLRMDGSWTDEVESDNPSLLGGFGSRRSQTLGCSHSSDGWSSGSWEASGLQRDQRDQPRTRKTEGPAEGGMAAPRLTPPVWPCLSRSFGQCWPRDGMTDDRWGLQADRGLLVQRGRSEALPVPSDSGGSDDGCGGVVLACFGAFVSRHSGTLSNASEYGTETSEVMMVILGSAISVVWKEDDGRALRGVGVDSIRSDHGMTRQETGTGLIRCQNLEGNFVWARQSWRADGDPRFHVERSGNHEN